jgi:hypothetical protein
MQFELEEMDGVALATRIGDPRLAAVYAYWRARRPGPAGGPSRLPGRADIEPLELYRVLPQLLLADVVGAQQRIRYRVVGTEIVARWGTDDTGRYLDEMPPGPATELSIKLYQIALSRRAALYSETNLRPDNDIGMSLLCRLILPLAGDGVTVDMVLAGQVQIRPPETNAPASATASLDSMTRAYVEVETAGAPH